MIVTWFIYFFYLICQLCWKYKELGQTLLKISLFLISQPYNMANIYGVPGNTAAIQSSDNRPIDQITLRRQFFSWYCTCQTAFKGLIRGAVWPGTAWSKESYPKLIQLIICRIFWKMKSFVGQLKVNSIQVIFQYISRFFQFCQSLFFLV